MKVKLDLHNHSCLSPCGSDDLTPALLAIEAMEQGIDIIALTDHNCSRNLPAFKEACELCCIMGIYGIEVNTIEDVHVLTLFKNLDDAMEFGFFIESLLPNIKNKPSLTGNQNIVNIEGEIIGTFEKSLLTTCGISLEDVVSETLSRDGLVIPAHIDRSVNSILANLGFLPDLPYTALEARNPSSIKDSKGLTILTGSDAHYFENIGNKACYLEVPELSFEGLKQGLINGKVSYTP
jgi:PHP family Zn ribbon phosphoesterase